MFLLLLFACIERRVREFVLAVYSLLHTEKKYIEHIATHYDRSFSLSHSLRILFCSLCFMLFLLFVVFVYFLFLLTFICAFAALLLLLLLLLLHRHEHTKTTEE